MSQSIARVTSVEETASTLIRRIVLSVDDHQRLSVPPVPDAAVGIYFPDDDGHLLPMTEVDGVWAHHDVEDPPEGRNYSIREDHGDRLVIDFVLHQVGVATTWARDASVGDQITLAYGRSWYDPPPDADWMLLVADLAGLPALARVLEELPESIPVVAVVEVAEAADLDYLPKRAITTVVPLVGSGNGYRSSRIGESVAELNLPEGRGYCWLAAEAAQSRAVRKHVRRELGWGTEQFDIIGYWRFDQERWMERYEQQEDELVAVYTEALDEGRSDREASELYDEALERAGL